MTDVVRAYKGLLKEKEALEASLSALAETQSSKSDNTTDAEKPGSSVRETDLQQGDEVTEAQSKDDSKVCIFPT